ncbi:bifunctional [glutamate--ammonia ligase]-adenylyl-L-tyrosine phosphorylase/[glutamate--ammonia-ligase] adenylyltransferase [Parasulfuritortus cantonensis]|uniref:Bifunctional glutamine synthetase adenylyltransferase/adenylyl-removing enzyme n=1 Tax=Parasulfuritortus cantonensis TaxID=2528202 RepID=A0A4R1B9P3_9PROT|nr:bifunctional [glutamate--ammonia ligase]-adenylyl-L-tyrosine phosphorylase/[glutamate--ammonia-ligase] adenylyltransferase [Parasulfuritortus cantonensis]TCJ13618.1 bifunctional [glutamate--ammonia ligase]-adenylyl-L-tyrosine phosphorylase/[glutamate--ammonia-ligase] adenylyltransferase [Parasulfuritortus cantonensis]
MTALDPLTAIAQAADYSRYLRARLEARPELAAWLAEACLAPFERRTMADFLAAAPAADEDTLKQRLRDLRQRVMAVIIVRDLAGQADLTEVTRTCTDLAEVAFAEACAWHHRDLAEIHGEPLDARGRPQKLIVVGMGKLGGRELNVSSDVDPIFVYPEDGETSGPRRIASHEFFVRLGRRLINSIGETNHHGFVFRVDMRLRPYGDEGPLVSSFAMLENYFYTQAREWERYAWIKARPLTGERLDELEALRRPFVFRKYLDFGAFAAMRDLHAQIRREVARKDKTDNVKLGPGGIREIEFIAQVFQLVRGGQTPSLQVRPTRAILTQLAALHLLPERVAGELEAAYILLRNVEHRLQYRDDQQTQQLPHAPEERLRLARALGYADWEGFEAHLNTVRRKVAGQFEQVFGAPQEDQSGHPLSGLRHLPPEAARAHLDELGYTDSAAALDRLRALIGGSRYAGLPAVNKNALDGLLPPLIEVAAGQPNPDDTLARILTLLEAIARRAPYLLLLQEYPQTLTQVARIVGASPWAAQYLTGQPYLLDELLDPRALMAAPDWDLKRDELRDRLAAYDGDLERKMDVLRHFKQSETFRLLAQDLAGMWTLEHLSDQLAALADLVLAQTLELVWADLPRKHRDRPAFAVIAYGKLGGKELGYASDLDIVFLYDDPHPDAQDLYARLGKRMNTWMTTLTAAGILYETDLRLRPDGASGLLVSSVEAFDDYQHQHAWTWEHQALTRARYSCGDAAVGTRFAAIREAILCLPRDPAKLRADVLEMRQKMHDGHPNTGPLFDLKHDSGGVVDVEFAVQYLILAHSARHPGLTANRGNIALLGVAGELGLIPADIAAAAADAYRELRRRQHQVKLQGAEHARLPVEEVAEATAAVRALWRAVFGV